MPESLGYVSSPFNYDRLVAGDYPLVTRSVVLLAGENRLRGTLLGKISVGGKYRLSLTASVDGSEVPDAILAKDTDASAADLTTVVYLSGEFNEEAVVYGTAHTKASVADGLRDKNIYLKAPVKK